ncbi:hypothetical protein [Streptomyces noursei]|uniref:hypothetical protein n=1 Tax=Streptomyces noursei TaxID=1971 RepID=UPI0016798391|nr:hypothetical protein [Streptomyces noursei]MCZ1019395.1 hypothetical protein [Streptomyces noursei]
MSEPQRYFAKMPYMACRGVTTNLAGPRPGQRLIAGSTIDVQFDYKKTRLYEFSSSDYRNFVIPEDGIYHVHFQASVWANSVRDAGDNINAYINVKDSTGTGVNGNIASVIQQNVRSGWYQTIQVSATEYFTKGSKIRGSIYLDGGAIGDWCVADGEIDTGFYAFMIAPGSGNWTAQSPGPAPELKKWSDGQFVSAQTMNDQTVSQMRAKENPPRVTVRDTSFNMPGNPTDKNAVSWKAAYGNDKFEPVSIGPGWGANTAITIPHDGLYLVSVIGNGRMLNPPAPNAQFAFQISLHRNLDTKPLILLQGGNARKDHESGLLISDVVRFMKGDKVNTRFFGYTSTSRWDSGRSDGRWWTMSFTYLGGGAYGN